MLKIDSATSLQRIIPEGVDTLLKSANKHVNDTLNLYWIFERNAHLFNIPRKSLGELIKFLEGFRIPEKACHFNHEVPHPHLDGFDKVNICKMKEGNFSCSHADSNGLLMACLISERVIHEYTNPTGEFIFGGRDVFESKAKLDMDVNQASEDGRVPIQWMNWAKPKQSALAQITKIYVETLISRLRVITIS